MVTQLECAPWTVKNGRSVSSAMNAARRIGHPSGGCLTPWLLLLLLAASSSNADNLGQFRDLIVIMQKAVTVVYTHDAT
ncbi:hypothetical protein OUZ56_022330 [Daphnia magna]|uniref:Uncharacterized protein n=1 Tax=Daphnia magna TaxID=35525 RepID=A0ABR0AW16_9CRUS|nr:hypothetical protein OUZ56_022330 [Daphnia magna]